jgi:hypothetical protein
MLLENDYVDLPLTHAVVLPRFLSKLVWTLFQCSGRRQGSCWVQNVNRTKVWLRPGEWIVCPVDAAPDEQKSWSTLKTRSGPAYMVPC